MSQVWLKRHLRGLSICGVFPLLRSFKAFKRFCILAMSSPLKHPTFAGSKRALASHGTVFYLCHLSLSLNNPISLRSNERHERPCCCFDKYFKIASRLLPHFSNLFETTRAICRGFWAIKCNVHTSTHIQTMKAQCGVSAFVAALKHLHFSGLTL